MNWGKEISVNHNTALYGEKMTFYQLKDFPSFVDKKSFNIPVNTKKTYIRAIKTGEKRFPKKGEWYLSGAIPEAYKAPNDLNTSFHILKLVKVVIEPLIRVKQC